MFCRTMFCQSCFKKNLPDKDILYLVYGQTKGMQIYAEYLSVSRDKLGFTPHLITVIQSGETEVVLEVVCGVVGCGMYAWYDEKLQEWQTYELEKRNVTISIKDFKALYENPDLGYRLP